MSNQEELARLVCAAAIVAIIPAEGTPEWDAAVDRFKQSMPSWLHKSASLTMSAALRSVFKNDNSSAPGDAAEIGAPAWDAMVKRIADTLEVWDGMDFNATAEAVLHVAFGMIKQVGGPDGKHLSDCLDALTPTKGN